MKPKSCCFNYKWFVLFHYAIIIDITIIETYLFTQLLLKVSHTEILDMQVSSLIPSNKEKKWSNMKMTKHFSFVFFCMTLEASKSFHCFAEIILPLEEKDETIGNCWCKMNGNLSHKCLHISSLLQWCQSLPVIQMPETAEVGSRCWRHQKNFYEVGWHPLNVTATMMRDRI